MRTAATLGDRQGRMLWELRPDLFPTPWLSDLELAVWGLYYEELAERNRRT